MAPQDEAGGACPSCGGAGYVVEQVVGRPAQARRCTCQSACPRCGETGFTLVPSGESALAQVCACRHLDRRIEIFNRIGIPAAVARASFESFKAWSPEQTRARPAAEEFARKLRLDRANRGMLFYGKPGCGKTHLLAAALRYLALEKGVPGRYVEFMLLLSDIRAGFESSRSHLEIIRPLGDVPVLAIDELGKERGTEWERSMLDELISRRYNAGLTTLFATNYSAEPPTAPAHPPPGKWVNTRSPEFQREAESMSLEERVGQRIYSRLNEMCDFVKMSGPDYRKEAEGGRNSLWQR
jgi:DNA replication protein DnaC